MAESRIAEALQPAVGSEGRGGGFYFARLFELLKFGVVGAASALLNIALIILLTEKLHVYYLLSIAVTLAIVTVPSFWGNRLWTFGKRQDQSGPDFLRYLGLTVLLYLMFVGSCTLCVETAHMSYQAAFVVVAILFAPLNYLLHRRWSFQLKWLQRRA